MQKLLLPLALAAFTACRAPATIATPAPESGAFVVMLGNDTISAESFTRVGNRIEGTVVRRSPRTTVLRYVMTTGASGLPERLEYNVRTPDGAILPGGAREVRVTFAPEGATTEILGDSAVTRSAPVTDAFPDLAGAVSHYALPIAALRVRGADSATFTSYTPGAPRGSAIPVARRDANRYWLYSFGSPIEITVDDAGRVHRVDATRTTVRIRAERQAAVDVPALARAFGARERMAGALGALSPRDSTVATVGGARLVVDYSRPSARGRSIWGSRGVLGDSIWRTGANAATRLITTAPITIGGRRLEAGTYVVTTLTIPGRYHLILSQGGNEVVRVPMQTVKLDPHVERFTILVEPTGDRAGTLRLRWADVELNAPFEVVGAAP